MLNNNTLVKRDHMVTYQITPDFGIDNTSNEVIASSFVNIYKKPINRISADVSLKKPSQVYFDILLEGGNANFYMSFPNEYNDLILGKMEATWKKCAFDEVETKQAFKFKQSNTVGGEMIMKEYNYHSLATNLKELNHLNSLFANLRNIKDNDKVLITVAIEPIYRLNWLDIVKDEIEKEKDGKARISQQSLVEQGLKLGLDGAIKGVELYLEYQFLILDTLLGMVKTEEKKDDRPNYTPKNYDERGEKIYGRGGSSSSTKKVGEVAKVNINILSSSDNESRARMNLISVAESYKELNSDNELILKELKGGKLFSKIQQIGERRISVSENCICSTQEIAKLIQLPHRAIQREHKLKVIDTIETDIPKRLKDGNVVVGIYRLKGKEYVVYRDTDKSIRCLPWVAVGAQNAGKTTLMKRIAYENYKSGDSNFVVDHIEDCKVAKAMRDVVPSKDRYDIVITKSNRSNIPSFSFNEISNLITNSTPPTERVDIASDIAEQVELIINHVADKSTGTLTDPMVRFLYSACMVSFIQPLATLKDVFDVLREPKARKRAINKAIELGCYHEDDGVILNLKQLDKEIKDSDGNVYTINNDSLIVGISNRITSLEKVPYIRDMLAKKPDPNEDFLKFIEEGKTIVISIPQYDFKSKKIRDMIVSYYVSRLWLAVQSRRNNEDARPCHIFLDEVYTIGGTMELMQESLTEFRRHRLGLFTTCHYLGQFENVWDTIKSCGTSYYLLQGTEKQQAELLKDEMKPFETDDLLELKQHHAIVIQNHKGGYAKYIARIPDFGESVIKG